MAEPEQGGLEGQETPCLAKGQGGGEGQHGSGEDDPSLARRQAGGEGLAGSAGHAMNGAEGAKKENGGGSGGGKTLDWVSKMDAEWGGAKAKVAAKAEYRESSASSEATPLGDVAFTSPTHKSRVGRHCDQLSQVGRVPNHNVSARVFELIDAGHARTRDGEFRGRGELQ